ncbi:MAG: DegV family protein, partial [Desulfobacterales bacterium]|nr:DegV family protein [Desulfobacterales bacterium]
MTPDFQSALRVGFECLIAWSDLLDEINVFPVADGDTGRNLIISLTPLKSIENDRENTVRKLLQQARGNSGNIAARFFSGFLMPGADENFLQGARTGKNLARQAVCDPLPGTMLTVFDALADYLEAENFKRTPEYAADLAGHLEQAVKSTPGLLPRLKSAGVVDSGALGMYIFFDGFFKRLAGHTDLSQPITDIFKDALSVSPSFQEIMVTDHCVDTVIRSNGSGDEKIKKLSAYGQSAVIIAHKDYVKVHLHTDDPVKAKNLIRTLGEVIQWSDDNIGAQVKDFQRKPPRNAIHIMTDAAGSVTREDAGRLGITLLDSYITVGDICLPETRFSPSDLYRAMRNGVKVSTSQASVFERHQHYQRVLQQYTKVLYICVGSVFTGNYDVVRQWKQKNDPDDRLALIDSTAASGRLGTIAIATARYSSQSNHPDEVVKFAQSAVAQCSEYLFLDRLAYLAAGGRLSKSSAFWADMLHAKPIISPLAEGAKKVAVVKSRKDQVKFALNKLADGIRQDSAAFIMLEYSDNYAWVSGTVG